MEHNCFEQLKSRLSCSPALQCENSFLPYELSAVASEVGVGAGLTQPYKTGGRPIAFCSGKLNDAKQGYFTHKRELLATACLLRTWQSYLHGSIFKISTKPPPLKYLDSQKYFFREQARWLEFMGQSSCSLQYIKMKNVAAIALSRGCSPLHRVSADGIKKAFSVRNLCAKKQMIQNCKLKYEKNQKLESIFP